MQGLYHLQASKEREVISMVIEIPDPTPEQTQERLQRQEEEARQQVRIWQQEAKALQEKYPTFSLSSLLEDEDARKQLRVGVSLKRIYLAMVADA